MNQQPPPLLWDLKEAARQLGGISTRTVRRLIDEREITPQKIGRRLMVNRASVIAYLDRGATAAHTDRPTPATGANPWQPGATKTGSIAAKTHPTGGHRSPPQMAGELARVLKLPTAKRPKRCSQNGASTPGTSATGKPSQTEHLTN